VYARHLVAADTLLHCGDVTGRATWSFFMQHRDFHLVAGNMDWSISCELADRAVVRLDLPGAGRLTIGMIHGFGIAGRPLWKGAAEAFGEGFDLVCFGHTHTPTVQRAGRTLVVNPGSLSQREQHPTFALVHVEEGGALRVEHVEVGWK